MSGNPPQSSLSDREREVLYLAADGLTDKEIAARLAIGPKTVRTYWDRIRSKLGAASRTQALALALREAYADLAAREARLRTFVESMPVPLFAFDGEERITAMNQAAASLTGLDGSRDVTREQVLQELFPNEEFRTSVRRKADDKGGDYQDWELPVTLPDGSQRTVAWSSSSSVHPVPGWASWHVGVDVTELRTSEARLRFIVEASDQGMWLLDANFKTLVVNRRMAEILGTIVPVLEQTTPLDYIDAEDLPAAQQVIAAGGGDGLAFRFKHCGGYFVPVFKSLRPFRDEQGNLLGFLIIVSERK